MAGVAADGPVLHGEEVVAGDDSVAARDGDENVAQRRSLAHFHDAEAVHDRFHGLDGVDFGDDDLGALALGAHGDALAAPAVTGDDHRLAGDDEVGGAVDAVPYRLAGAVAVVEEMLALGVVDQHHGDGELVLAVETLEAEDSGGGLFAAADHLRDELREIRVQGVDEVASVIDDDVGAGGDDFPAVAFVLLGGGVVPCEDVEALVHEGGGDVVLGGEGIAAGDVHVGAAGRQDLAEVRGLRLEVDREGDLEALEGLLLPELFFKAVQKRHVMPYPFYFQFSVGPEGRIPDFA